MAGYLMKEAANSGGLSGGDPGALASPERHPKKGWDRFGRSAL